MEVPVAEPRPPRRTRRPIDGVRILLSGAVTAAVVLLAVFAEGSFRGFATDLLALGERLPAGVIDTLEFAAELAAWILPVLLAVVLLWRRELRTIVELLAAGVVAGAVAASLSGWLAGPAPGEVQEAFSPLAGEPDRLPVPPLPALIVAVVTVTSRAGLRRITQLALFAVIGTFAAGLLQGAASVAGTLLALGIGRVIGLAVRVVSGEPPAAPSGHAVAETLTRYGYQVSRITADPFEGRRRYVAETGDGPLGVLVLDRTTEGAGMLARLVDRLRAREEVLPRRPVTLRTLTDRMTLLPLALAWAGVRTPRLRHVTRLNPDVTLLVHDHIPGRPVEKLAPEEFTDEMLADLWRQLGQLRAHELAHRRLAPHTILAGDDGKVWLLNPSGGEVAAPELALRTDLAQALVVAALVAGPERTVASAIRALGAETVAGAAPLLQPLVLTRNTRAALRAYPDLLLRLRDTIAQEVGGPPPEPARVRRFRPLSLVTGLAAVVALYLVGTQLAEAPVGQVIRQADWGWVTVALLAMALNYVGAAYALLGFVPERVPFPRTLAAQVTLGFVRLLGPVAVSGAAINLRLLTRAGVAPPLATASVAAYQLGTVAITLPLIVFLGVISGLGVSGLRPSVTTFVVVVAVIAIGGLLVLIPQIRTRIRRFWHDFARRGVPRLLDLLNRPRKLVEAIGGTLLQTVALVACFYACVRAVGSDPDPAALAVIQMVGNTVGTAAPTPGGLGAVEAALTAGVTAIGTPAAVAVPAVLLFRIVSFWLPILPAWLLWSQLQRRDIL